MRKVLIVLLVLVLAIGVALYAGKVILLNRFKVFFVEKVESATGKGLEIESINYVPFKGVHLTGIEIYSDAGHAKKELHVSSLFLKFPVAKLLSRKIFSPTINIRDLKIKGTILNGSVSFSLKLAKKPSGVKGLLSALGDVRFYNLSAKNAFLFMRNLNGFIALSPELIKVSNANFILNNKPYAVKLEVTDPAGNFVSNLSVSSSKLNITSHIKKENDIYKITAIEGEFFGSVFELIGEFNPSDEKTKDALLSLYGKATIDIKDISYLAPTALKEKIESSGLGGTIKSSLYFKGNPKDIKTVELGIKSSVDALKIRDFVISSLHADIRLKDGKLTVPILSARPYKGELISSLELDLTDELWPYRANVKLRDMDIALIFKETKLQNIKGFASAELAIKGDAKNFSSTEGVGRILINNANLGPAPILTPLLGNIYGYLQNQFSGLKKIEITNGSCDFYIANRKIVTENLMLWGGVVSIHAEGYLDFDKKLNFEVENQFAEPDEASEVDWQATLQSLIASAGKLISKAYLTGDLKNPKWKFEYLSGVQDLLKDKLRDALKNIF